jgi:hypothetical protein
MEQEVTRMSPMKVQDELTIPNAEIMEIYLPFVHPLHQAWSYHCGRCCDCQLKDLRRRRLLRPG